MPKYKVTISTLFVDGVKYTRGDIIETDFDYGTCVEPYVEEEKPKRKRKAKSEVEAEVEAEEVNDEDQ